MNHGGARRASVTEPRWVRWLLTGIALLFLGVMLFIPLAAVFWEALRKGFAAYGAALIEPDALSAIRLTLLTAAIAVPLNLVFGVAAAWAIAKFEFRGKNILITLIDLPFAVSPVVSGLIYVLVFERRAGSAPGSSTTTSRSSSRCRASCWPPSSSPSPSWPAS
jgi:sulfate transport system permease protein